MRLNAVAISCVSLLSALLLTGCGNSDSAKISTITFKSAAIDGTTIPTRYTCDGADTSPPLEWGEVPTGTGTLVLFVVGVLPEPATNSYKLSVEWAVAGVNPSLHRLSAGQLPPGAYVGEATDGKRHYSICPKRGQRKQYQFELYALPAADSVVREFAGGPVLLRLARKASPAIGHGDFIASYKGV